MPTLDPTSAPPHEPLRGWRPLALLVDARSVQLLEAAHEQWADHGTIEFAVDYHGKPLSNRLTRLTAMGLLEKRRAQDGQRGREHRLTAAGEGLLALRAPLAAAAESLGASDGARAKLLTASVRSSWDRIVGRVLLDGLLPFTEVQREACALASSWGVANAELGRAALTRSLHRLQSLDLVAGQPSARRNSVQYKRGPQMWRLSRLALQTSLWCCTHTPQRIPPLSGELPALVAMLIDRVRLAGELGRATAVLHVQPPDGERGWVDAALCADGARLLALPAMPREPTAYVQAPLGGWCEALLAKRWGALAIEGDRAVAHAMLDAIAAAMPPA